ncbi:MAG: 1-acyl-sn-glycerol-3-phosphate acyltransferase [Clostridia bacterium]|nr:1-acyl-sn-glycerol-3-phosphate acyltransferase [Clostridia bacterium]
MADKTSKKKKDTAGRPVEFMYRSGLSLYSLYLKVFRKLHIDRSGLEELRAPYLVVCNHQSMADFCAVARIFMPDVLIFVVTTHFFADPVMSIGLKIGGCLPKKQFISDLTAVRRMLKAVRSGKSIAIFPEGQTCYSGQSNDVDPSIGKLVKLMGVPVVNVQIRGNFLTTPKYSHSVYPSYAEAKGHVLLTAEQVAEMTDKEIAEKISEGIAFDEYEWERSVMKKSSRPRDLEGIENILWLCPSCGREHTMATSGRDLFCTECGYRVSTDDYGFLHNGDGSPARFDTPPKWFNWQYEELEKQLIGGTLLPFTLKGRFLESGPGNYSESGYCCHGEGTATINQKGLVLDVTRDGEPFTYKISPEIVFNLTHSADLWAFDIPDTEKNDTHFAFDPEESRDMMKVVQTWTLLRRKYYTE